MSNVIHRLKQRKVSKSITLYDILLVLLIFSITFSLRFYNASDLSGGDDSQFAELATYAIQDPIKIVFPHFPDEPISYQNRAYARPVTVLVYVLSILILGHTKYAVILPATLFCALSAILFFSIVKRQFDEKLAFLALVLFLFSPFSLAVSRIGLLHSQLMFFGLLGFYFIFKYLQTGKIYFIYLSTFCWLLNQWTSDLRGLVVAAGLIPIVFNEVLIEKKIRWNDVRAILSNRLVFHLAISTGLIIVIYFIYVTLAWFIGEIWLFDMLSTFALHATGQWTARSSNLYMPFFQAVTDLGKYIFLTPLVGFIFIPMIFGIIVSIRHIKELRYSFWLFYLAPIILFYAQGQFAPDRQVIFLPAIVMLASIGLYYSYDVYVRKKSKIKLPLLVSLSAIWGLTMIVLSTLLFQDANVPIDEISNLPVISLILKNVFLVDIVSAIIVLSLFLALFFLPRHFNSKTLKTVGVIIVVFFVVVNAAFCIFAVMSGFSVYKRSDAVSVVGKYIENNIGDEKYACISGTGHDKSLTFYSNRMCVHYSNVEVDWIDAAAEAGDLKYFIINMDFENHRTSGLGVFKLDGTLDESNDEISPARRNYPEKYEWLVGNTVDITEKTGLDKNNPHIRIREYKGVTS